MTAGTTLIGRARRKPPPLGKEQPNMTDRSRVDDAKQTLAMTVANTGFIVEQLGKECAPLQFLRELTQNSIEAILDTPEKTGEILWDVDWNNYDLTGQYKLAIIDTGVGMTGDEMLRYINQLSSSSHEQAYDANFGVGAKVAAATRNPAGLLYLSWKDGQGWLTHLWRDPDTGQWGLARRAHDDGRYSDYSRLTDDVKPSTIGDHGTMVVLMGNDGDHNTMEPPEGLGIEGRNRWIQKYLNTRYFRFPEGIEVRVREAYQAPRDDPHKHFTREVRGQKWLLDSESDWYGTVKLEGATAHAWILKDDVGKRNYGDKFAASGHMAALYQDELYEMVAGRAGVARLQLFGVIFGHNRVVIYVEPHAERVFSNTARTQLLIESEPLPWAEWAAEFRDNMPEPISELMAQITGGTSSEDHKQAIKERLRQIQPLLTNPSRYRRMRDGEVRVTDSTVGGAPRTQDEDVTRDGGSRSGTRGGRAGGIYALFVDEAGDPAEEVFTDPMPDVKWISEHHDPPTRTADLLEDRAAKFMPDQNLLQINADFRIITDLVTRWCDFYSDVPGAQPVVESVIHEWFEQALIETVIAAQALKGSPQWTLDDLAKLWSEEGLTSAVLQRYHIDVNVRRALGSKLGSLREKVAA